MGDAQADNDAIVRQQDNADQFRARNRRDKVSVIPINFINTRRHQLRLKTADKACYGIFHQYDSEDNTNIVLAQHKINDMRIYKHYNLVYIQIGQEWHSLIMSKENYDVLKQYVPSPGTDITNDPWVQDEYLSRDAEWNFESHNPYMLGFDGDIVTHF